MRKCSYYKQCMFDNDYPFDNGREQQQLHYKTSGRYVLPSFLFNSISAVIINFFTSFPRFRWQTHYLEKKKTYEHLFSTHAQIAQ